MPPRREGPGLHQGQPREPRGGEGNRCPPGPSAAVALGFCSHSIPGCRWLENRPASPFRAVGCFPSRHLGAVPCRFCCFLFGFAKFCFLSAGAEDGAWYSVLLAGLSRRAASPPARRTPGPWPWQRREGAEHGAGCLFEVEKGTLQLPLCGVSTRSLFSLAFHFIPSSPAPQPHLLRISDSASFSVHHRAAGKSLAGTCTHTNTRSRSHTHLCQGRDTFPHSCGLHRPPPRRAWLAAASDSPQGCSASPRQLRLQQLQSSGTGTELSGFLLPQGTELCRQPSQAGGES